MTEAAQSIFHFLLMLVFITIFVLSIIIVKPFLINYKRKVSTISLKLTYLIYLAALLISVYLFMFYGPTDIETQVSEIFFFSLLLCLFIPNIAILFRRKFKRNRSQYNYIFSFVNLAITAFIIYMLDRFDWFIF